MAAAACAGEDAQNGAADSDLSAGSAFASVALTKIGGIPLGVNASFGVLDDDHAIWGAYEKTSKACSETPFTRFSTKEREADLLPAGAWSRGRISPNGRWVAAIGTVGGTCRGAASELRLAPTTVAGKDIGLGTPADFDFAGDLVVRFENDGARALAASTGDQAWSVVLAGGTGGVPFHAVGPAGDVFVYASGAGKVVANDGTVTEVTGFPTFSARTNATPRATFVSGTILAELPMATGWEIWKITKDGAVRLAQTVGQALYADDKSHFAVVSTDGTGTGRAVDVYSVASLIRSRVTGLDTVSTIALSAKGDRVAASGMSGTRTVVASAPTDADAAFTVLGEPGGAAQTIEVLPDGRVVFNASVPVGTSSELGMFVASTKASSLKRLAFDDTLRAGALSFTVEPGATPTAVIAQKIIGKAVLLKLDGSGSTDLPSYSANVAWTNGFDFYSFQDGATLGVVTAKGHDTHAVVPNENPVLGTRFSSGAASPSGRFLFVAAGAGVYRIDTIAPPASASSGAGSDTSRSTTPGATPGTDTSTTSGSDTANGGSSSTGASNGTGSSSSSSSSSSGSSSSDGTSTQRTMQSGGCATTGGNPSGVAAPLALGLVVSALLRRRRRA